MANIDPEIRAFQSAVYGEEVRSSMVSLAQKLNKEVTDAAEEVDDWLTENAAPTIEEWLDDHPEATTTVEDYSITSVKIAQNAVTEDKVFDGAITEEKINGDVIKKINNLAMASNVISTPLFSGIMGGYADGLAVTDDYFYLATCLSDRLNLVVIDRATNTIVTAYPGINTTSDFPVCNDISIADDYIFYAMGDRKLWRAPLETPLTSAVVVTLPEDIESVFGICIDDDYFYVADEHTRGSSIPQKIYKVDRANRTIIKQVSLSVPFGMEEFPLNGGLCVMGDYIVFFISRPNMLIVYDKELNFVKFVATDHSAAEEIEGVDYDGKNLFIVSKFPCDNTQTVNEIRYTSLLSGAFSGDAFSYSPINPDDQSMGAICVDSTANEGLQIGTTTKPFNTLAQAIVKIQKNRGYNTIRVSSNNGETALPALFSIAPLTIRAAADATADKLVPFFVPSGTSTVLMCRNSVLYFQGGKIKLENITTISSSHVVFYSTKIYGTNVEREFVIRRATVIFENCEFINVGSIRATAGSVVSGSIKGTTVDADATSINNTFIYT